MVLDICQPPQTSCSYIYLGFYYDCLSDCIIKPSYPPEFPVTFDLIRQHCFAYSVKCFLMPTCLQPVPICIAVVSMTLLKQTLYNYTGTTPTSYNMVFEPCHQTLIGMVGTQWWNEAWHYMQIPKHSDELANWASGPLAMSSISFAMCNSIFQKVNLHKDYMVL